MGSGRQASSGQVSRRAFLQQAAGAIAALGLTELALNVSSQFSDQARAYSAAVAQPSGRKLALLIGIDNYPANTVPDEQSGGTSKLAGCTTDVELQRSLLIHRFGFAPQDIVCLTNKQATRQGIYDAFDRHLLQQAKSGDVVVFHFSGYGAQIRIEDLGGGQTLMRSLVPADGLLPSETRPAFKDISEAELKSLLKQLDTKNITTVLDAGFVDIPVPLSGGLRSRARSAIVTGALPAPFPLLADRELAKESEPFPGVLLRAANVDEVVLERQWEDFNAGAFTYVLTQFLWSAPAPVTLGKAIGRSKETLLRWGGSDQQPTISGKKNIALDAPDKTPPIFDTPLMDSTRGEGVILDISSDGKTAEIWLGGLPPRVLEYMNNTTVLTCQGRRLQVRSQEGLTAKAKLIPGEGNDGALLQVGLPVMEAVRVLPKDIDLVVALDSRLQRIERVDATSALSALPFISSTSDTGLPADCLLAKPLKGENGILTASLRPLAVVQTQDPLPNEPDNAAEPEIPEDIEEMGYGLFSLTRSLIPGTLARQDEAIKPAITRLTSKLQALSALKLLRLTENRIASKLPVRVTLEQVNTESTVLIGRQTLRTGKNQTKIVKTKIRPLDTDGLTPQVSAGGHVRYRVFNDSEVPLYYTLITVDPRERLSAFCPVAESDVAAAASSSAEEDATDMVSVITAASIAPGSAVAIPGPDMDWAIEAVTGPVETYVICSAQPLNNTIDTLLTAAAKSGSQRISPLPNPLDVVQALLADISRDANADSYQLEMSQWATLNFTYEVV